MKEYAKNVVKFYYGKFLNCCYIQIISNKYLPNFVSSYTLYLYAFLSPLSKTHFLNLTNPNDIKLFLI
jgi:hypothetical protein